MPVSQLLNPKATIKKSTTNDLPYSPAQPVISHYVATSTTSQVTINLNFSVDQSLTDQFLLYIDGKLLTLGSSNDYTFTAIGSDNTSSQVTLNSPIISNLNINAFKLGLKKESEFQTDNRFVQLYAAQSAGFQGWVSQTDNVITATSTTGTPAAGTFYSAVVNRASMSDISQDLKPRLGIERIMTQGVYQIQNEVGSAGEPVWGALNDPNSQIRFVGTWTSVNDSSGANASPTLAGDYVEVTFNGTGINLLTETYSNASVDIRGSVDGGSEGSNLWASGASYSAVINARNYATNNIIPVVSDLTDGIHTVKIRVAVFGAGVRFYGFEVLHQNLTSIKTAPGTSYLAGKQRTLAALNSTAYNSAVTGTRGGRMAIYQNSDASIGYVFNATNASTLTGTSTDHTNEELARQYFWREFGANRADDFTSLGSGAANKTFTLDDGTTTLTALNGIVDANVGEALSLSVGTANFATFTFVGTGVDVQLEQLITGFTRSMNFSIDGGATFGAVSYTNIQNPVWVKLASGLPYGTHTVKCFNTSATTNSPGIMRFNVYQPKSPTIPSGAIQLGSYNVMANFSANSTQASINLASGVLRKLASREVTYVGSWSVSAIDTAAASGFLLNSTASASNSLTYTFFGTGFDMRVQTNTATTTYTLQVDSASNFTTSNSSPATGDGWTGALTTGFYGTNVSFVASTGVATLTGGTAVDGAGIYLNGMTLGMHTVKVTWTSGTGSINLDAFDLIVPIHSHKSDLFIDINDTLSVGSQYISDDRKFTPVIGTTQNKAWAQATGVASGPSTSSTSYVPMPDMSVELKVTTGNSLKISSSLSMDSNGSNGVDCAIYIDGIQIYAQAGVTATTAGTASPGGRFPVSPGWHKVQIYWRSPGGTSLSSTGTSRILTVEEV